LPFEFRIAGLQKKRNELVEDGPDNADAEETKSKQEGLASGKTILIHGILLL